MKKEAIIDTMDLSLVQKGTIQYFWLDLITDPLGNPVLVPIMIARGEKDGPTLGLTAAVHGNELNGIPVIQRLFREIDVKQLKGTIVGVPVVNIPSFIRKKRRFNDGVDLNHIFPGVADGNVSQVYAYRLVERIIKHFDILIDLHTASFGRINSYYIRADMNQEKTATLARLQNAQIIVNNSPSDGTLRGAADELQIPAITLEVGNPNMYQKSMIRSGMVGIHNVLSHIGMTGDEIIKSDHETVQCLDSYWIYTNNGGLLQVHAQLLELVEKNQKIATIKDVFGRTVEEYFAPENGIVVGKSVSPVNQTGGRILHLGLPKT